MSTTEETLIKADKDYKETLNKELPEIDQLAKRNLDVAVERLLVLEKKVRQASDLASSQRVLSAIVQLLVAHNDWDRLNEIVQLLVKKHGQLKTAIATLVQDVVKVIPQAPTLETKVTTIENVRTISEGRIFLELERARVTQTLAGIKVKEYGDYGAAADLMGELQVETYGSMNMNEKTDFILEQLELYIKKGDFAYAAIVSRKIMPRYFADRNNERVQQQKVRYYELCIKIALHEYDYVTVVTHMRHVYETPQVEANDEWKHRILGEMVLFAVLAPHDNLQSDMLHRLAQDTDLPLLPLYDQLATMFTTDELIRWPRVEEIYGKELRLSWVFSPESKESQGGGDGDRRYGDLHKRITEHNIRVVAKFYTRISLDGLNQLLDLSVQETEENLARLVVSGMVWARIDRPKRIVSFAPPKDVNDILNEWSANTSDLLQHIETIGHLIAKDEMMHGIRAAAK